MSRDPKRTVRLANRLGQTSMGKSFPELMRTIQCESIVLRRPPSDLLGHHMLRNFVLLAFSLYLWTILKQQGRVIHLDVNNLP